MRLIQICVFFCGACISVCPSGCIVFSGNGPEQEGECSECGTCLSVCPGLGSPLKELDKFVFGREKTEDEDKNGFGIYISDRNLVAADNEIFENGYTGGKISATLIYMLEKGLIDAAIVSRWGNASPHPWVSWPVLATTRDDIMKSAGSKYVFSPNLALLKDLEKQPEIENIAVVGLGCHLQGLRKLQNEGERYASLVDKIKYTFGLYCGSPMVRKEDLVQYVATLCGVEAGEILTIDFKRVSEAFDVAFYLSLDNGREVEKKIHLMELFNTLAGIKRWPRCGFCTDYSAELSDISFGGVHVTCRTPEGEAIINGALNDGWLTDAPQNELFDQMAREMDRYMSRVKKVKHRKNIISHKSGGSPVPDYS